MSKQIIKKSKPYCIFCEATDVWLYCSYKGEGICETCIKLAALSLRDRMMCLEEVKMITDLTHSCCKSNC